MDSRPTASFPTVRVSASDAQPRRTPFSPNGREGRTLKTQHYSTTPKTAPNREYFDFIRKGGITLSDLESTPTPGPVDSLASRGPDNSRTKNISVEDLSTLENDDQEVQEQGLDAPTDELDRIPVSSNIMAFARKSIMQHATTQPRSIFSRLNEKKLQGAKPASLATAQPSPAATNAPSSSRTCGLERPTLKSTTSPFVSRPNTSPTVLTATTVSSSTPSTLTRPVLTPAAAPKPPIPGRSVLDFSGASGSALLKKKPISFEPPTSAIAPPPSIMESAVRHSVPSTLPPAASEDTKMDDNPSEKTKEQSQAKTEKDPSNPVAFDLRALLRQDSARVQYRLPNLVASLSPPTSPKRPSPYDIPSLKEREALRARRMPRFKARPLNPKVFTSAGDLGVPRIPKQPLTVPKSPVFSRTRVRRDMISTPGQPPATPRTSTAARLQSVLREGVKRSRIVETADKGTNSAQTSSSTFAAERNHPTQSSTTAWSGQLSVPSVDQVRLIPKTPVAPSVSSAVRNTPRSFPPSNLRRPNSTRPALTNPRPFKFATTELQRKRMKAANSNALTLADLA
ncbi:hypothetical protein EMPS_01480 [Entomortierella parvispora]|uniref:TPX2 central domain-containing protein n=1 Tax=Entomortierella parvispora TaxID=205924 RepID=A0A9P3H2X0_9FUNG|nr:hypothetical protein EMPS_01480 [Entomortierella parvispora]